MTAAPPRHRAVELACLLLVLVGTFRLFALVLHTPMLGYANQYDMARTSACVDLWPALPPSQRYGAHQSAPLPRYVAEHVAGGPCYPSSGIAFVEFARLAVGAARWTGLVKTADFPLQAVGALQAFALLALVLAFCRAERARPWARLAHATVFAVVLADPADALWMNTLYTEFGALFFAYAVAGLLALATIARPRWPAALALIVALAGLAGSRQQYAPFAAIPLLILLPYWWGPARRAWIAAAAGVVVTWTLQVAGLAQLPAIHAANNHDFYLGAALPAVHDEAKALQRLGLPSGCRAAIGSDWFVGMGADPQRQCPEVESLGRLEFLRLVRDDPALPWRILVRGLPLTQLWWQHHLGMIAGSVFGDLSRAPTWLRLSLASAGERMPLDLHLLVLGMLAAALATAAAAWIRARCVAQPDDGWLRVVLLTCAAGIYAPVSAIFGDGYSDVARHALLLHPAVAALALLGIGRALCSPVPARSRVSLLAVGAAYLALVAAFAGSLSFALRHWPAGFGVIDLPATRHLSGDVYSIRGWAVDPWGVGAVRVAAYPDLDAATPMAVWDAGIGLPVGAPQGESLVQYFPNYPGAADGGFALDIPRSAWPAAAPCLRTRVQNLLGVVTEIDRRCIER